MRGRMLRRLDQVGATHTCLSTLTHTHIHTHTPISLFLFSLDHIDHISALVQAIRAKKKNDVYILAVVISFFAFITIVYWMSQTTGRRD